MDDFQPLADAISAVNANASSNTPISKSSYTPSNTPRACPAVAANTWLASDILPPTPNTTICENMVASSSCVPAASLSADDTAALFGTVCGLSASACEGITANATSGVYGDYVMCNATQQLANALNTYYVAQKSAASACDFDGQALVVKPSETLLPSSGGSSGSGSSSVGTTNSSSVAGANSTAGGGGTPVFTTVSAGSPSSSSSAGIVVTPSSNSSSANGSTTTASAAAVSGSAAAAATVVASSSGISSVVANETSANSSSPTQSSGSGKSGAAGFTGSMLSAGWAGSLLAAVGAAVVLVL